MNPIAANYTSNYEAFTKDQSAVKLLKTWKRQKFDTYFISHTSRWIPVLIFQLMIVHYIMGVWVEKGMGWVHIVMATLAVLSWGIRNWYFTKRLNIPEEGQALMLLKEKVQHMEAYVDQSRRFLIRIIFFLWLANHAILHGVDGPLWNAQEWLLTSLVTFIPWTLVYYLRDATLESRQKEANSVLKY